MQDYLLALTTDDHLLRCTAQVLSAPGSASGSVSLPGQCVCASPGQFRTSQSLHRAGLSSWPELVLSSCAQKAGKPHLSAPVGLNVGSEDTSKHLCL